MPTGKSIRRVARAGARLLPPEQRRRVRRTGGALLRRAMAVMLSAGQAGMLKGLASSSINRCCRPPFQWLSMLNSGKPVVRS